jgi:16S rRNA processing protein RimM
MKSFPISDCQLPSGLPLDRRFWASRRIVQKNSSKGQVRPTAIGNGNYGNSAMSAIANRQSEIGNDPLVAVARAVKTRGLKGELVADLLTDFPERFAAINRLICVAQDGSRSEVELEDYWFQQQRIVLKLDGIDDIAAAAPFVGCEFAVPESERVQLSAGEFYDWELQGCGVGTTDGRRIGHVREVMRTGGVDALVVEGEEGQEYLVPLVETIVVSIDIANKAISIDPPEGLLEL